MGRIADAITRANEENRAALVIYLCAGDPSLDVTEELVVAAAEAGADIIELGMPFSDPTADGVAIQRASKRALDHGATLRGVLETVARVRARTEVPILLFGYYNPLLAYGEKLVVRDAKSVGADGFLVVDLPPEEASVLRAAIVDADMDFVPLVAPTSTDERVQLAADAATSFIYYVSMTGVTGAATHDLKEASVRAKQLQSKVGRPVALGFGVKTGADVSACAPNVSAIVVGSAIVTTIEQASDEAQAIKSVRQLVSSFDRAPRAKRILRYRGRSECLPATAAQAIRSRSSSS
ncbi:MAG: tryptophan synthase subunit alpha [Polyangiales bacterium]